MALPERYSFGDNFQSLDLRLSREFLFRERWRLVLIGEVFNVYNAANLPVTAAIWRAPGSVNLARASSRSLALVDRALFSWGCGSIPKSFQSQGILKPPDHDYFGTEELVGELVDFRAAINSSQSRQFQRSFKFISVCDAVVTRLRLSLRGWHKFHMEEYKTVEKSPWLQPPLISAS